MDLGPVGPTAPCGARFGPQGQHVCALGEGHDGYHATAATAPVPASGLRLSADVAALCEVLSQLGRETSLTTAAMERLARAVAAMPWDAAPRPEDQPREVPERGIHLRDDD